jgi:hypothetical protein
MDNRHTPLDIDDTGQYNDNDEDDDADDDGVGESRLLVIMMKGSHR